MNYKLNHFKIYQNIIQLMYFINKTISKKKNIMTQFGRF